MKLLLLAFVAATVLIGGALYFTEGIQSTPTPTVPTKNNVAIVDGKQIITIGARGGYLPERSIAKAGIPTIIRFDTRGTFDCSSFVRIPSMDVSVRLPSSGVTDVDLGTRAVGTLQGMCAMGMYPFEIVFEE